MPVRPVWMRMGSVVAALSLAWLSAPALSANEPAARAPQEYQRLAHDIFKQLIEINTTDSAGNVTSAAEAMAIRLREAGFDEQDMQIAGPRENKKNLVVRYHGSGARKPVLFTWTWWKRAAKTGPPIPLFFWRKTITFTDAAPRT
jgi:hypothetical protein